MSTTITSFTPQFQVAAGITDPLEGFTPINSRYCLTFDSAQTLAQIFADLGATVVLNFPLSIQQFGGGFSQVGKVPWLKFPNGFQINAGAIASAYFARYPFSYSYEHAREDLQSQIDAYPNN